MGGVLSWFQSLFWQQGKYSMYPHMCECAFKLYRVLQRRQRNALAACRHSLACSFSEMEIAILGLQNAGKSSFVNVINVSCGSKPPITCALTVGLAEWLG